MLGGYLTPMEDAINDLLLTMRKTGAKPRHWVFSIRPKAIYVSTTNTVDGVPTREDIARPFKGQIVEQHQHDAQIRR